VGKSGRPLRQANSPEIIVVIAHARPLRLRAFWSESFRKR
jgi:hypothetical protein